MATPGAPRSLVTALKRDYAIGASRIEPHPGGFESECWVVDDAWFVKVWKVGLRPQSLELLDRLQAAGLPVVVPVRTGAGARHSKVLGRDYAVFRYVRGRTATHDDWPATVDVMKQIHSVAAVDLPTATMDEPWLDALRDRLDHPWIRDRARAVKAFADRLEVVIAMARATETLYVVCHRDLQGGNLLINEGRVAAIVDWDWARSAPREHDLWIAMDTGHSTEFLERYGARDLDATHLEYSLLARALRDLASRVIGEVDRPGIDTWGFDRLDRLERDLEILRSYCR